MTVATEMRKAGEHDDIDELRDHCERFFDQQGKGKSLSLAKSKASEMIFWLRLHREQQALAGR